MTPFPARALQQLAQRLATFRREVARQTPSEFAAAVGVSLATITALEAGEPTVRLGDWLTVLDRLGQLKAVLAALDPLADAAAEAEARRIAAIGDQRLQERRAALSR